MELSLNLTNTAGKKIEVLFLTTALGTGGAKMMLYKLSRINREFSPTVVSMIGGDVFVNFANTH